MIITGTFESHNCVSSSFLEMAITQKVIRFVKKIDAWVRELGKMSQGAGFTHPCICLLSRVYSECVIDRSSSIDIFNAGNGHLCLRAPATDRGPHRLPRGRVSLLMRKKQRGVNSQRVTEEILTLQAASDHQNVPMLLTSAQG